MSEGFWSPWHGCHKCSPGCVNCYVYYLDSIHQKDASVVTRSKTNFDLPLKKDRKGNFKIQSGSAIATCFTSDFFLPEADQWRKEAWEIIKQRKDLDFLICTKRIQRVKNCLPDDWNEGYDNVKLAVTVECQQKAEERLPIFADLPAKSRYIFVSPILEKIDIEKFLASKKFSLVSVGGESYKNARVCDYEWVKALKGQCDKYGIEFDFHQTGSNFLYNGKLYSIKHKDEYSQAKKALKLLNQEKA